jgi:hypothetical protein
MAKSGAGLSGALFHLADPVLQRQQNLTARQFGQDDAARQRVARVMGRSATDTAASHDRDIRPGHNAFIEGLAMPFKTNGWGLVLW